MAFHLVDASTNAACTYVDAPGRRGRIWPVYQTAELLMARAEIDAADKWKFSARDFTYFFFVEAGRVSFVLDGKSTTVEANQGIEIPENREFELANSSSNGPSYVVLVAGQEVLPGSFFNSFNSAYLNA